MLDKSDLSVKSNLQQAPQFFIQIHDFIILIQSCNVFVRLIGLFVKIVSHHKFIIMATLIPLAVVALAGPAIIALVFFRK